MALSEMTFYERFEADILAGKKTITIRDKSAKNYSPNSIVQISTYETNRWFCALNIKTVEPILFDGLTEFHAEQENMTLPQLKNLIREIYLDEEDLYVISFELIN